MKTQVIPVVAAGVMLVTGPPVDAEIKVQPDKDNVVASRLEGDWEIDDALNRRLGVNPAQSEGGPAVSFKSDPAVAAKIPARFENALANRRVYLAGIVTFRRGQPRRQPRDHPFLLIENHGNPHVVWFRERAGEPLGDAESFSVMLAVGKEPGNDVLFIGGDFNNQPFYAYARAQGDDKDGAKGGARGGEKPRGNPGSRPPALRGDIKHQTVAEFPLPRDRTEFGIGEEVDFWIEPRDGEGPDAVIAWWVDGAASVFPVLGIGTRVTLDLAETDGELIVRAERRDRGSVAIAQEPASTADLKRWLRDQVKALPQGEREPVGMETPQEPSYPKKFSEDLYRIDALRNGKKTSFDKVEDLGRELLAKYAAPRERGQIYYWLAHVHAQSGLMQPQRAAAYAQKALEHPLEPLQVPRLYVYWGDAVQVARGEEPLAIRRRHAAVIYLAGLREVIRYPLPATAPKPPPIEIVRDAIRNASANEEEAKHRRAKQAAARELVEFQTAMIHHRDVLVRQIGDLYKRQPVADDELRELAVGVLREPWAVDRFLKALKGAPWEPIRP